MKAKRKILMIVATAVMIVSLGAPGLVNAKAAVSFTKVEEPGMMLYRMDVDESSLPKGAVISLVNEFINNKNRIKIMITSNGSETIIDTDILGFYTFIRDSGQGFTKALPVTQIGSEEIVTLTTSNYDNLYLRSMRVETPDLDAFDYRHLAISRLVIRGIVTGYNAKPYYAKFQELEWDGISVEIRPDAPITRAQFALILGRTLEANSTKANPFSDVKATDEFAKFTTALNELGIITGSNGKFMPNDNINKEQASAMIARTLRHFSVNTTPKDNASNFTDISKVSSYAKQDVLFLEDNRIYPPSSSKTFNPKEKATRGDVFFMLYRALEVAGIENYLTFHEVEGPNL